MRAKSKTTLINDALKCPPFLFHSYAKGLFSNKWVSSISRAGRDPELLFGDIDEQVNLNLFPSSLMLTVSHSVGS